MDTRVNGTGITTKRVSSPRQNRTFVDIHSPTRICWDSPSVLPTTENLRHRMTCSAAIPSAIKPADTSFLTQPIHLALPTSTGIMGFDYADGDWIPTGGMSSREERRLRDETERLTRENVELNRKLNRAATMIADLQLDLKKLMGSKSVSIKFNSVEDAQQFQRTGDWGYMSKTVK